MFGALAAVIPALAALAGPDQSTQPLPQTDVQTGPEALRATLLRFVSTVSVKSQSSSDLYFRIADMSAEELQALYNAWPDPTGFTAKVDHLMARAPAKRESARLDVLPREGAPDAETKGIIGILSPCEGFAPDYPSIGWLEFIEGIIGEDLTDEKSRCSDDLEETFITIKTAAVIAATIAQAACDSIVVVLGEGTNVPFCVAAGIANGVKDAAEFVLEACAAQDAAVNAAEIEAGYENTKIIIDALCCVTVDQQRKIQGCNGQDDDCDGTIDECDEDVFGPAVFVDPSVAGSCFADAAEAQAALQAATNATDDCGAIGPVTVDLSDTDCDATATIAVADDCGNQTQLADSVSFRIDGEAPTVTCDVTIDTLFPPNLSYTDVGFSYTAVDNCAGELEIAVKVTSDEQTTLPPGKGMASPFPDAVVLKTVDGTIVGVHVRNERGMLSDGRVYMIHVYATDSCGNVGYAACTVSVSPADGFPAVDSGQYFDATGIN